MMMMILAFDLLLLLLMLNSIETKRQMGIYYSFNDDDSVKT